MPRINTNIAALNAQRNIVGTETSLRSSLERLSSGLRINRAADDAAGLSISEKLRGQVRGLNQAVANAQDTINLIGTAEGAMNESTSILQRMRELAVQSANDTNTDLDRQAIQDEVVALKSELTRISDTTQYNGKSLLDGTFNGTFQIGANASQTVSKSIDSTAANALGRNTLDGNTRTTVTGAASTSAITDAAGHTTATTFTTGGYGTGAAASYSFTIAGSLGTEVIAVASFAQASDVASSVNSKSGSTGVSAKATTTVTGASTVAAGTANFQLITSTGYASITANVLDNDSDGALVNAINAQAATTGVTASIDSGKLTLTSERGENIVLRDLVAGGTDGRGALGLGTAHLGGANNNDRVFTGTLEFDSAKAFSLQEGTDSDVVGSASTSTLAKVSDIDLSSQANAADAIKTLDKALEAMSRNRSGLGALQNRLQSTINNLSVSSENLANAESRIRDVDFATEVVAMTRSQILQQSGTSILAQANQLPQSALSLLR